MPDEGAGAEGKPPFCAMPLIVSMWWRTSEGADCAKTAEAVEMAMMPRATAARQKAMVPRRLTMAEGFIRCDLIPGMGIDRSCVKAFLVQPVTEREWSQRERRGWAWEELYGQLG